MLKHIDLKEKLTDLKNYQTKLNEASLKIQQEISMLQSNLNINETNRIGVAAQIKLVDDLLKEEDAKSKPKSKNIEGG